MSRTTASQLQRQLAAEFEKRGWEYDLETAQTIAAEILRSGRVDPPALADLVPRSFAARSGASKLDVAQAISRAFAETELNLSPSTAEPSMRILFFASGPTNEARLRLEAEYRDVKERIRASSFRDQVTIESVLAARKTDLIDALNRFRPSILHIAAHGDPSGIVLENDAGESSLMTTDQLRRLVGIADPALKLVCLNACESSYQAEPMTSVVDAAIGMTTSIGDDAARGFASQLYPSLAEGVRLDRAFEQAKLALDLADLGDEDVPRLFLRHTVTASQIVFTGAKSP